MAMPKRDGEQNKSAALVDEGKIQWDHLQQCDDTNYDLGSGDNAQPNRVFQVDLIQSFTAGFKNQMKEMQHYNDENQVGDDSMVKLDCAHIFKKINPCRAFK